VTGRAEGGACARGGVEAIFDRAASSGPEAPTGLALEEVDIVGLLRRAADQIVEPMRVFADEDASPIGLDPVEDDGRSRRGGRNWKPEGGPLSPA
jgi:hypothetical protein